jgi:signal transduction histidine kinase
MPASDDARRPADRIVSELALWRAVAVFRILALGYAALLLAITSDDYARPALAWAIIAGMAAWTAVAVVGYERPDRRRPALLAADLAVAVAAVLSTRLVDEAARVATDAVTLPTFWAAAPVLAWAVAAGGGAGALAALAVGAADIAERGRVTLPTAHNVVLLVVAGAIVGYGTSLVRRGERAYASAVRVEAAARERERLARDIHDGVLQVLALVARRGAEAGGEAARSAASPGTRRRPCARSSPAVEASSAVPGETADLCDALAAYAGSGVTFAMPATPVVVAAEVATEVAAAIGAALDNVRRHAAGAHAWLLVEDEGDSVVVSLRDDGPGMAPDRLAEAAQQGRLGVAQSVRGRVSDLGGTVEIRTSPGAGTEIELRVPRRVPA